jgi:hypothetical protein
MTSLHRSELDAQLVCDWLVAAERGTSGHNIHTANPQFVARAIEEVVEAAAKGVRLVP